MVFRGENAAYKFIEVILKEFKYCKKLIKKHLNKNLIMTEKEEEQFQSSKLAGYGKNLLMMTMKKLEIIVT